MRIWSSMLVCLMLLAAPLGVVAQEKVALVAGMGEYTSIPKLRNPSRDANGVADRLEEIGFHVTRVIDGSGSEMRAALEDFSFRAETADTALIYFAGHGVEVQGENFLIPVDAEVASNRDVQLQSVSLRQFLAAVDSARRMRIVILDSCRDNPFGDAIELMQASGGAEGTDTRGAGGGAAGGLAPPDPERGTLVAFAARDGHTALDALPQGTEEILGRGATRAIQNTAEVAKGGHSPFAAALIAQVAEPGIEIGQTFRGIRDAVVTLTNGRQEPFTYGSLPGSPFYIAGKPSEVNKLDPKDAWANLRPDQADALQAMAEQGDTRAQIGLAYIRLNGNDPRFDPAGAAQLLERASKAGSAEAQFELAKLYELGIGVPQDQVRALQLFEDSAAQGFGDALNDLGFHYFQGGLGLQPDPVKAIGYFVAAAEDRHPEAMFNLAALVDDGIVPGSGPEEVGELLYRALRSGAEDVYKILSEQPNMFKRESRMALQRQLAVHGFYTGAIDGALGRGSQAAIRSAHGLQG